MHGASEQCMQATEIDFSAPTMPSLMVTTRRRLTPHGTSFSCLHAVTQPLHSMQRSASHRNFILAMAASLCSCDLTKRRLGFLHQRHPVIAVGRRGIRSEEHTSELQSPCNLVCRLLLEKKKKLYSC